MKTLINVTKDYIEMGVKSHCRYCPVALAINREFPNLNCRVEYIYVHVQDARGNIKYSVMLPDKVSEFIASFDQSINKKFEPFEFEIDLSEDALNLSL